MSPTSKISVVIIAFNEEEHIGQCIKSCLPIADEVIVVDSMSTDATVEISRAAGATVIPKKWAGYGQNKNHGVDNAKNDWILSIDADELLTPELQSEIKALKLEEGHLYWIRNRVNYCGHWIKYTEWRPAYKARLYHRNERRWNLKIVHESLYGEKTLTRVDLDGMMWHYSYTSYEEHLQKTENYAKLSALRWLEESYKPSLIKRLFGPSVRFIKSYIFQLGFLDGVIGYQVSKMSASLARKKIEYYDLEVKKVS